MMGSLSLLAKEDSGLYLFGTSVAEESVYDSSTETNKQSKNRKKSGNFLRELQKPSEPQHIGRECSISSSLDGSLYMDSQSQREKVSLSKLFEKDDSYIFGGSVEGSNIFLAPKPIFHGQTICIIGDNLDDSDSAGSSSSLFNKPNTNNLKPGKYEITNHAQNYADSNFLNHSVTSHSRRKIVGNVVQKNLKGMSIVTTNKTYDTRKASDGDLQSEGRRNSKTKSSNIEFGDSHVSETSNTKRISPSHYPDTNGSRRANNTSKDSTEILPFSNLVVTTNPKKGLIVGSDHCGGSAFEFDNDSSVSSLEDFTTKRKKSSKTRNSSTSGRASREKVVVEIPLSITLKQTKQSDDASISSKTLPKMPTRSSSPPRS